MNPGVRDPQLQPPTPDFVCRVVTQVFEGDEARVALVAMDPDAHVFFVDVDVKSNRIRSGVVTRASIDAHNRETLRRPLPPNHKWLLVRTGSRAWGAQVDMTRLDGAA